MKQLYVYQLDESYVFLQWTINIILFYCKRGLESFTKAIKGLVKPCLYYR